MHMIFEPHRWCNGIHARLECGRSWDRALVGPNHRLIKLVFAVSLPSMQR